MTDPETGARPSARHDPTDYQPGETRQAWLDRRRAERAAERAARAAAAREGKTVDPPEQYDPDEWLEYIEEARELVGTDPSEALARMVAKLLTVRGQGEVAALVRVAHLLGVGRSADDLGEEDRRWAAMTPAERAAETLRDPVHGPLIRQLVLDEQCNK